MRVRIWVLLALTLLLTVATACTDGRGSRGPVMTPVPPKTLRPTFTNTPAKPTSTPTPAPPTATPTAEAPTDTPVPPTPEATLTPTPAPASFTVTGATLNVRSGPGTSYNTLGQIRQGQTFPITGKNSAGNWWQFDYNGRAGWVSGQLVRVTGAESVQVAANIPAPPTSAPRPTARPTTRPAATQPPATTSSLAWAQAGAEFRNADNTNHSVVTFWGRLGTKGQAGAGSGYTLSVSAPGGSGKQAVDYTWQYAYTGQPSEFLYNVKLELPRAAGAFRAVILDSGGNEVSDPINGTLLDITHDVLLNWNRR